MMSRLTVVRGVVAVALILVTLIALESVSRGCGGPRVKSSQIDAVQSYSEKNYPRFFSSVMTTDNGSHIVVSLTQLDPAVESSISSMASPGVISFKQAPWTETQILATQSQVAGEWDQLQHDGINIVSIFPSINGDALVHLGVVNLTPAQLQTLSQKFGRSHILVTNVLPANVPQV